MPFSFVFRNAPWTRYDDTRITRSSWKQITEDTRTSIMDTSFICFYRRLTPGERVRAAQRKNKPVSDDDLKEATEYERKRASEPQFVLSPVLPEIVGQDNAAFLRELATTNSNHYLQ